jgi:hypothetical protein
MTVARKNVIFKTTASNNINSSKSPNSHVKNKNNSNILEDFPTEITKTHDIRKMHQPLQGVKHHGGDTTHGLSLNDSINEI